MSFSRNVRRVGLSAPSPVFLRRRRTLASGRLSGLGSVKLIAQRGPARADLEAAAGSGIMDRRVNGTVRHPGCVARRLADQRRAEGVGRRASSPASPKAEADSCRPARRPPWLQCRLLGHAQFFSSLRAPTYFREVGRPNESILLHWCDENHNAFS